MPAAISAIQSVIKRFQQDRLIAVIRADSAKDALWGGQHLVQAGIQILEVTYTVPEAETVIEALSEEFPDVLIGAGTVIEAKTALSALGAGAQFLASPVLEEKMVQFGAEQDILILPGVATPTEMYQASKWGASLLKLFPAAPLGGPAYLKSVLAPMPHLSIVPTGGLHSGNFLEYLNAGAMAVGLGTHLLPHQAMVSRDENLIKARVAEYLTQLQEWQRHGST